MAQLNNKYCILDIRVYPKRVHNPQYSITKICSKYIHMGGLPAPYICYDTILDIKFL